MRNEAIAKSFPATAMEGMYLRELQGRRPIAKKRVVSIAESGRLFYKRFAFFRIKAHRK